MSAKSLWREISENCYPIDRLATDRHVPSNKPVNIEELCRKSIFYSLTKNCSSFVVILLPIRKKGNDFNEMSVVSFFKVLTGHNHQRPDDLWCRTRGSILEDT